jgi:hypothetical protein
MDKNVVLLWKTKTGRVLLPAIWLLLSAAGHSQQIDSFRIYGDVIVTIDRPVSARKKETVVIFYALPNGNSTAWTMGKRMRPGDDWHFDIQHISAQTAFIRKQDRKKNYVVIYLANDLKSWPAWKQRHPDFRILIPKMVDSLSTLFQTKKWSVHLNGHSGGGSFIFGYLAGVTSIPGEVTRISFLDSNYGYGPEYASLLMNWLGEKERFLSVFAYNDSIALLNGKPVVSATGGTWYKSQQMLQAFQVLFPFKKWETDSLVTWRSTSRQVSFFLKKNTDRGIYHTQQVELNGFIHSVFAGTRYEEKGYRYYGRRAYEEYIQLSGGIAIR